uniref:Uncharacterized protein n=1 Tax=Rhizophora mucronata TaxID=61149 RepID=A0A2P2NRT8_RHIMU
MPWSLAHPLLSDQPETSKTSGLVKSIHLGATLSSTFEAETQSTISGLTSNPRSSEVIPLIGVHSLKTEAVE